MINFAKRIYRKILMAIQKFKLRGKVIFDRNTTISRNTTFEGGNRVAEGAKVINCHVGYGTIIGHNSDVSNTVVGKYSSVSLAVIRGRHPVDHVSTHPAFYSCAKQAGFTYVSEQCFEEFKYADPENKISVIIGNDVWLTKGCQIVEGVTIGDGAVVLNSAVVTKDVPPYAIVGGVPAKVIKYRFDQETIDWLLELKWWDKDEAWKKKYAAYFSDPKELKKILETETKS